MKPKKFISVVSLLMICICFPLHHADADKKDWESDIDRSISITVTVDEDHLYVWLPSPMTGEVYVSMEADNGSMYSYELSVESNQPGVISIADLPVGVYSVNITTDGGMEANGVLTVYMD